jgi:hypothetical protein
MTNGSQGATTMTTTDRKFIVVTRTADGWSDQIGENEPRSWDECATDVDDLAALQTNQPLDDDPPVEYEIWEVDEDGRPWGGRQLVA